MVQIQQVQRAKLSDIAFDRIKAAIIRGELEPLQRIRDNELAESFGLSRTPVREAVNRLVDMNLCETKPSSHTRVSPLTRESVQKTLQVHEALDRLAVITAVPKLTASNFNTLETLNTHFNNEATSGNIMDAIHADMEFHNILYQASENATLIRHLQLLEPHVQRILHVKFSSRPGSENSLHHHEQLIDLIKSGQTETAASLSGRQWSELGGQLADLFPSESSVKEL